MGDEEVFDTPGDYIPGVGPFGEEGIISPPTVPTSLMLPETLQIAYGSQIKVKYDFIKIGTQRRLRSTFGPLHSISIVSKSRLTASQEAEFYGFYADRRGGYESFGMFDFTPDTDKLWTDVFIGSGDGVTQEFDLKGKSTSNLILTVGGVETTAYTKQVGIGTNYQDKVVFDLPPSGIIKAKFNGIRYFPFCLFTNVELARSLIIRLLYTTGFDIEEYQP
jgi:hypothetical protein